MLISKFDLRKSEWLELVFAKRNKEYGAYYIRQQNAGDMIKAMGITFTSITIALIAGSIMMSNKAITPPATPPLVQTLIDLATVKPLDKPKPDKPMAPAKPISTQQSPIPLVVDDAHAVDVPELRPDVAIGPENKTVPGGETGISIPVDVGSVGAAPAIAPAEDVSVHTGAGVDVMPEPIGGAAAWNKFLQKNVRYPDQASDRGISGKVWVSFVVEKDGQISNITVDRGAGYGMDEEAVRVLKLSKSWKPGQQNGRPVRVKYTLPLAFILND